MESKKFTWNNINNFINLIDWEKSYLFFDENDPLIKNKAKDIFWYLLLELCAGNIPNRRTIERILLGDKYTADQNAVSALSYLTEYPLPKTWFENKLIKLETYKKYDPAECFNTMPKHLYIAAIGEIITKLSRRILPNLSFLDNPEASYSGHCTKCTAHTVWNHWC